MKRFVLIIVVIFGWLISANAQNYTEYLQIAYDNLANGNIENAEKAYSVYCKLTNSRNLSFEEKLKMKSNSPNQKDFVETAAGLNMKMVYVEGGDFLMGATS